jgi:uncharacterized protein YciI
LLPVIAVIESAANRTIPNLRSHDVPSSASRTHPGTGNGHSGRHDVAIDHHFPAPVADVISLSSSFQEASNMTRGLGLGCWVCLLAALVSDRATFGQSKTQNPAPTAVNLYWIFLTTGKSTQNVERDELQRMQAAHLANFDRLHKEGKLFAAGPLADPEKRLRGIVVATAPDLDLLLKLFEPDPYLKHGYLNVDAIKMEIAVGKFQTDIDPKSLAEYRLVVLEKATPDGAEAGAAVKKANLEYCEEIHNPERLCFAAWFKEVKDSRRGILVFRKLDEAMLDTIIGELPAVKSKAWKASIFLLHMSDGIVK